MSDASYRNMRLAPVPMLVVNPLNHYWIIGGSTTEVYSSATNTLVPVDDTNYTDWLVDHTPSPIATEQELQTVLIQRGAPVPLWLFNAPSFIQPTVGTYDKPQLKTYSSSVRYAKSTGGIIVNGIPFPTDAVSLGSLNAAYIYVQTKGQSTFSWKLPDGTFITLDTPGITNLQSAVAGFGQSCFVCEDDTATAIDAGTITDLPAIDAAYAAVSNVFTGLAGVQRRK